MYAITSRDRRVTDYVRNQAYAWLYNKIGKGEYDSHGHEAEGVILRIKEARAVTKESYAEFLEHFKNDPYFYMLEGKKSKKSKGITTSYIADYFMSFNDDVLPVGFVRDFFEDDYETAAEIDAYMSSYTEGSLEEFVINCQKINNKRAAQIEKIQKNTPSLFNTKVSFHVLNVVKMILAVAAFVICVNYFANNMIIDHFAELVNTGSNRFLEENFPIVLLHAFLLIFILVKVKRAIVLLFFYIRFLYIRIYVMLIKHFISSFNSNTTERLKAYFEDVIGELKGTGYVITPEMCSASPSGKRQYMYIVNFKGEKISKLIEKLTGSKRYSAVHFYYDSKINISVQKVYWKKGIITSVIIILLLSFTGIPELRDWLIGLLASTPLNKFIDFPVQQ